jgi:hypothetical protein
MENEDLTRVCNEWYETAQATGKPTDHYDFLRVNLPPLLSDQARAAVASQGDTPVVVAIDGSRFLCLRIEPPTPEAEQPALRVSSLSLDSHPRLDLQAYLEYMPQASFAMRRWTLIGPDRDPITVSTRKLLRGFSDFNENGDALMIEVADRLGWPLPRDPLA